jgi:putative ABC transport system permease protein
VTATATLSRRRLDLSDVTRLSTVGLRTRKLRAGLSALGIAIGVAAIVAVLGLSASSQAGLLAEINQLGTNLLTVSNGQSLTGGTAELPISAPPMIRRISGVEQVQSTGAVTGANAYRTPYIPSVDTNGLTVEAASLDLLPVLATTVAQGRYLNAATAQEPVAVIGATAAQLLGIDRVYPEERIWVGGQWFYLAGILKPAVVASTIDTSVLVGYPAAEQRRGRRRRWLLRQRERQRRRACKPRGSGRQQAHIGDTSYSRHSRARRGRCGDRMSRRRGVSRDWPKCGAAA